MVNFSKNFEKTKKHLTILMKISIFVTIILIFISKHFQNEHKRHTNGKEPVGSLCR